ncbi:MAG: cell division protein FtsZ [Verrucomicrobia bacterium]|nr:cell division protein FtsZ [Verrucomicrobiota bacterium]
MMESGQNESPTPRRSLKCKVFGVGGAGCNVLKQMAPDAPVDMQLVAINTDTGALLASGISDQFVLGEKLTRGLGSGGDPEVGRAAAITDAAKLKAYCEGADIVFIIAGLGGGTGTGASPILAKAAKEAGALVLSIVTQPFQFEGSRRSTQADEGFAELKRHTDTVIAIPNQKIFKLIDEKTNVRNAFTLANNLVGEGVLAIHRLLSETGLVNVDFSDLCSVTRGKHSESALAVIEAKGAHRVEAVLEKIRKHPMLSGGVLEEADSILVNLTAGDDFTMLEVSELMEKISEVNKQSHFIFGAGINPTFDGKISVTLVTSRFGDVIEPPVSSRVGDSNGVGEIKPEFQDERSVPKRSSRFAAPAPDLTEDKKRELFRKAPRGRKKTSGLRQGQLPLETVSKGRFDKSEPTLYEGQDLDVPTYIRRNVVLN